MLSLTKKSEDQLEGELLWHSDFRSVDRLPDTKVVRTTFFVNTAAIAAALALLMWAGYREFHIRTLDQQIAEAQQQIDSNTKQNKEAIRLSQLFLAEEKKLVEAASFIHSPISTSEFIELLGQTLPKEVSIEYAETRTGDARNQNFIVRGLVAGSKDQASGSASSYVDVLRANPRLSAVFDPITLERLNPDGSSNMLSFEISMKVKTR